MKRSKSYDESDFRLMICEGAEIVDVAKQYCPTPSKPFTIWSSDDESSSDECNEDTLSPFPRFAELFEPEPLEQTRCELCGKTIIIGEEGDYNPGADKVICYPFLESGCQQKFLQIKQFISDTEKSVVLRHSGCNYKPERRRSGMMWAGNVCVHTNI